MNLGPTAGAITVQDSQREHRALQTPHQRNACWSVGSNIFWDSLYRGGKRLSLWPVVGNR